MSTRKQLLWVGMAVGLGLGCGGEAGEELATTQHIEAATGGTITIEGTGSGIEIPANALASDMDVTVRLDSIEDYPALAGALDLVIAIEPEGTALANDARVTIDPDGPEVAEGKTLAARQLRDGEWVLLPAEDVTIGSLWVTEAEVGVFGPLVLEVRDLTAGLAGAIHGSVLHIYTEEPLPDYGVALLDAEAVEVATSITDASGEFTFADVAVGAYTVKVDIAPEDNCYGDPDEKSVTVVEDQTAEVWFGFVPGPCG